MTFERNWGERVRARRLLFGFLTLGMALVSAPVLPPAHLAHGDAPKVLRVALTQNVDSLNPFISITAAGTEMGRVMYEFLTTYDPKDQHAVPALATAWNHSADGLTWAFTIRDNAKWSDGQKITSDDIAYTYNLMLHNPVARTANGNFVANFDTVTAPNDTTLVITTKAPQSTMLALDIPIVPRHVWEKIGLADLGTFKNTDGQPVGSGPFLLTEFRQGQYVKFAANKSYWRGAPKIDELDFIHFDNAESAVQALIKGDVDLINQGVNLAPAQFDKLKSVKGVTLNKAVARRTVDLLINPGAATVTGQSIGNGNPALKDVAVRRAIAQSIDVNSIADKAYGGYAQPGNGDIIPPVFDQYHWTPPPGMERKFDLNAAATALDAAGYRRGADGIRVDHSGKPLRLNLIGRADRAAEPTISALVKGWLGAIGIPVDVQLVDSNKLNDATTGGNYDLALSGWGANPDPDYVLSTETCAQRPDASGKGGTSAANWCDRTYDALYAQQLSTLDTAKRADIVKQMQQIAYQQVPEVTLVYPNALEAYRSDRFNGFQVQPDPGGVITQQNGYWGYFKAEPGDTARSGGASTGLIAGIAVVVVAAVAGGLLFTRRRRASVDDRE